MAGQTIDMTSALTALSRMMGKRTLPQGDNSDWEDYVQEAFNYAWRYYKWDWSLRYATVDLVNAPYLPADFDIAGYRKAIPTTDGDIPEIDLFNYGQQGSGMRNFALEYNPTESRYDVLTGSGLSSISMVYQTAPPDLSLKSESGQYIPAQFPSAQVIGLGASIWAKQGENPTRAEVSQEWDMFHAQLDRLVGRVYNNVPRNTNLNLQDYAGTYTGDTRY